MPLPNAPPTPALPTPALVAPALAIGTFAILAKTRPILMATRVSARTLPKPLSLSARNGLRYERKIGRALAEFARKGHISAIDHNPWFTYTRQGHVVAGTASPDFVFSRNGQWVILECKLTWVPEAEDKLLHLYRPIVALSLGATVDSICVVTMCRNLVPETPHSCHSLAQALTTNNSVVHWPETGPLPW